jgi:hypothetical protein
MVQREMPFQYIHMHGLFHEDMMVHREENGQTNSTEEPPGLNHSNYIKRKGSYATSLDTK